MTLHNKLLKLKEHHYDDMSKKAQKLVDNCLDGLDGLGEVLDCEALIYISEKQVDYINKVWERYGQ